MSAVLSPQELEEYTLKTTSGRQKQVLDFLGIRYRERPDGTLIVLRIHAYGTENASPARREPQLRLPS